MRVTNDLFVVQRCVYKTLKQPQDNVFRHFEPWLPKKNIKNLHQSGVPGAAGCHRPVGKQMASSWSPYPCASLPPCCVIIVSFRAHCCLCRQAISCGSVAPFSVYIAFNLSGFSSLSCLTLFFFLTGFNFTASSFGDSFFDQPSSKASKDGAILLLWRT